MSHLTEAQNAIATILRDLEAATGSVVRRVDIADTDFTMFSDDRRKHHRIVQIEIERLPGTRWAQADTDESKGEEHA